VHSDEEIAAKGEVRGSEISRPHHEAWNEALDKALEDLDGAKWANKELIARHVVQITPNPGGISHYKIELVPKGTP
jgi:flavin-binding protein dodecin